VITVRPLRAEDHEAVLVVVEELYEWFDERARRRAIPVDLAHQDAFVAVGDGVVAGFITLYVAEGRVNIGWMGVRPGLHRQGVGTLLLASAEEYTRLRGLDEIATHTLGDGVEYEPYERTRRFYLGRGFSVYQRSTTDNPGCPEEIRISKAVR
jgi:GNAT superfamily N-acetyltransferase